MGPVTASVEFGCNSSQLIVVQKSSEQFIVAGARFVGTRENGVHKAQLAVRTDALRRDVLSSAYLPGTRCVFECANNGCTDCHNPPAARFGLTDGKRRCPRDAVGLVEGQPNVQFGIAGRRYAGCMSDGHEINALGAHLRQRMPVKRESRRWRFE